MHTHACGCVLIRYVKGTEIFDEVTGWSAGPPMGTCRFYGSQSTLIGGRVLVCGGLVDDGAAGKCTDKAEIFDSRGNRWCQVESMTFSRQGCSQSTLNNGVVMVRVWCSYSLPLSALTVGSHLHVSSNSPCTEVQTAPWAARFLHTATHIRSDEPRSTLSLPERLAGVWWL